MKLLRRRKRFSQPALAANSSSLLSLTVAYICFALIILRDTLSWHARLLITHSRMFMSTSSLDFFQAARPCCCLPRTDAEAQFDFFAHLSLSWVRQRTSSGCFSIFSIFYDRKFEFQVVLFRSRHVFFLDLKKINELDSAFI